MAGAQAQATGSITIGGVTAPITFPVSLKAAPEGVQIEGDTRLDMTKFGIEPPVVMLGMLKVRPDIRIAFKGTVPTR
jgi:polyisoprenoid-binding protein YceI